MARGPGSEYERRVADYMRGQGAKRVHLRVKKRGETGAHPHEVDVHAEFYSRAWDLGWQAAALLAAGGTGAAIAAWQSPGVAAMFHDLVAETGALAFMPDTPLLGLIAIMIVSYAAFIAALVGRSRAEQHYWIECKDLRRPVKRDAVFKLNSQVSDVRKAAHGWQPSEVWIVSSSGFDPDALAFAAQHGIRCATIPRA